MPDPNHLPALITGFTLAFARAVGEYGSVIFISGNLPFKTQILPLQMQDDNNRYFDYRREDARTDWERDGLPNEQWEELLLEAKRRAEAMAKQHERYSGAISQALAAAYRTAWGH